MCQNEEVEELAQSYCTTCNLHLCVLHTKLRKKSPKTKIHALNTLKKIEAPSVIGNVCKSHPSEKLELICTTCNDEFICYRCYTFDHRNHDYISIREARKLLENERESNVKMLNEIEETITKFEKVINEVDKKAELELEKIQDQTQRVIKAVEDREKKS